MALDLTALNAEVARLETVETSVSALLKRLYDDFEANKGNPAEIQASVDRGRAAIDKIAASVVANTPAAGTTPPPTTQPPTTPNPGEDPDLRRLRR